VSRVFLLASPSKVSLFFWLLEDILFSGSFLAACDSRTLSSEWFTLGGTRSPEALVFLTESLAALPGILAAEVQGDSCSFFSTWLWPSVLGVCF